MSNGTPVTVDDFMLGPFTKDKTDEMMKKLNPKDNFSLVGNIRQAYERGRWEDALAYWNEYVIMCSPRPKE